MDEATQLLMNISKYDDILNGKTDDGGDIRPPKIIKRTETEKELDRMRLEMAKMIATSYGVIEQAKSILDGIDNVEDLY